ANGCRSADTPAMFRRLLMTVREWGFILRAWLAEWLEMLTSPVRSFHPRQFAAELFFGGKEAASLGRSFVQGTSATVVGFFWFLFWLPVQIVGFAKRSIVFTWWWLRTRTRRQLALVGLTAVVVVFAVAGPGTYLLWE